MHDPKGSHYENLGVRHPEMPEFEREIKIKQPHMNEGGNSLLKAEEIARLAIQVASEKQGTDIVMLDVRELCSFADYFVICSANSNRHMESIWQAIKVMMKSNGITPHHSEGTPDSGWMLADYGAVIVHIFAPPERDYYQLDKLWDQSIPVVRIQ